MVENRSGRCRDQFALRTRSETRHCFASVEVVVVDVDRREGHQHDFLNDDVDYVNAAKQSGSRLVDVRRNDYKLTAKI